MTDPAVRTRIQARREIDFWLMHDPEGDEFCLCRPIEADA